MTQLVVDPRNQAIAVEQARQKLAECKTIVAVKVILDKAKAVQDYYKRLGKAYEASRIDAGEIVSDAGRRIGELSANIEALSRQESGAAKGQVPRKMGYRKSKL